MKIRNRLAIVYTVSAVMLIGLVSLAVYMFSSRHVEEQFYQRLQARVDITEQLFLEKDNLAPSVYQDIRENFLHTLPQEIEIVEPLNSVSGYADSVGSKQLPREFIIELLSAGTARFSNESVMGLGKTYEVENRSWAVIVVAQDTYGNAHKQNLLWLLLSAFVFSVLVVFLTGRFLARQALKPIAMKIEKAKTITALNLDRRLIVYNENDELGQLALAFNNLLDRLQESFELQRNFVRGASHEIRNPLAAIMGQTEVLLAKERTIAEYQESLAFIQDESLRLNDLVNDFLVLSRTEMSGAETERSTYNIVDLITTSIDKLSVQNPDSKVIFRITDHGEDTDLSLFCNEQLMLSVFLNLLDNACKFSDNQQVEIKLEVKRDEYLIEFCDQGIGFDEDEIGKVFEPLYRGNRTQGYKGTGIGLAIVNNIVKQHKGSICIKSNLPMGARVQLQLPR